ncbi:MAG: helix-turn-helix domain-containing protein [Actinomycetota bacterium]
MDIADVVEHSGLPPSTLHHYESKGLIEPSGRRGLRRQYDDDVLERLALIALGRDAGFTLAEIATMLPGSLTRRVGDIDRAKLETKADELDATIDSLILIRDNLRHAARCPAPSHLECDSFRRLLDDAMARRRTAS